MYSIVQCIAVAECTCSIRSGLTGRVSPTTHTLKRCSALCVHAPRKPALCPRGTLPPTSYMCISLLHWSHTLPLLVPEMVLPLWRHSRQCLLPLAALLHPQLILGPRGRVPCCWLRGLACLRRAAVPGGLLGPAGLRPGVSNKRCGPPAPSWIVWCQSGG